MNFLAGNSTPGNDITKVEIDEENKKLYVYFVQDNSMLMSNPPPPPSYYRKVYSFDGLKFEGREEATVTRSAETITWPEG